MSLVDAIAAARDLPATDPPREHPLSVALPGWRWLHDPSRGATILLHTDGLWVEVADEFLPCIGEEDAKVLAGALLAGVAAGLTGRRSLTAKVKYGDGGAIVERTAWVE